jgi:hypothetical protein
MREQPFWRVHLPDELIRLTGTLQELNDAVVDFRKSKVRVVAGLGGDGTVHHLAEALLRHYGEVAAPIVLALAGGTMNGLPRALGSGGRPDLALEAAVRCCSTGSPPVRHIHLLCVTEATGIARHGFGFATGLVFRAYQDYYRSPDPGMVDAIRATLLPVRAALFGGSFFDGISIEVRADDGKNWLAEPVNALMASVLEKPLLWFEPFGPFAADSSSFHMVATSMRPRELAPRLWSVFRGRCRHPRLRVGQYKRVSIRSDTGYLIDGELFRGGVASDLTLTVGPQLSFLAPFGRNN